MTRYATRSVITPTSESAGSPASPLTSGFNFTLAPANFHTENRRALDADRTNLARFARVEVATKYGYSEILVRICYDVHIFIHRENPTAKITGEFCDRGIHRQYFVLRTRERDTHKRMIYINWNNSETRRTNTKYVGGEQSDRGG